MARSKQAEQYAEASQSSRRAKAPTKAAPKERRTAKPTPTQLKEYDENTKPKRAARATPKPKFKIPKSLAACADMLYETRQKRYALNKEVDELESQEAALREHLINNVAASKSTDGATGISGKVARATVERKEVIQLEDWKKLCAHIKKTGEFDLLQHRVSGEAVKERWNKKKSVPGVKAFTTKVVSLSKL